MSHASPDPDEPTTDESTAHTSGEQDHRDPDQLRGEDADPPTDTGTPPQRDADQAAEPM